MRWIALPLICFALAGVAATAATARTGMLTATTGPTNPLATGIGDPIYSSPQAAKAYQMTRQAGAKYTRNFVYWSTIAPRTQPVSWDPTNPNSPYYKWHALDATVSAANANGVTPILDIVGPPSWAYHVAPGTWTGGQPDLGALAAFATAIAKHYNNLHAPYAHVFSVWNEPNFNRNLFPQDPGYYRSMVNAVADAVHAVNQNDLVGAGELAPFKHAPSKNDHNSVTPPLTFMKTMLSQQSHFDFWAHHPYSDTGPFGHAKVAGGVELGDLPKMNAVLQANSGNIVTGNGQPVQFWVTEVGWSSNKPNPKGVPLTLEQRWTAETMYQIWKSGATVATWFLLMDDPLSTPFQSGLYFRPNSGSLADAQPKPLLQPFQFPLVAYLKPHGKVLIWGRDTTSSQREITIQDRVGAGGAWKNVGTITSNNYGIFTATLALKATTKYWVRADDGSGNTKALAFALKVPKNENLNVTPFPLSH